MSNENKNNEQFVLSYELLALMRWIMVHESEALKRIITRAISQGLGEYIDTSDEPLSNNDLEELQHAIGEFMAHMDCLLIESCNDRAVKCAYERNLIPTLDQLDTSSYDNSTIRSSLAVASSKIERHPEKNPKDVLYKELLKQWKPCKLDKAH